MPDAPSALLLHAATAASFASVGSSEATSSSTSETAMDQFWLPPCTEHQLADRARRAKSGQPDDSLSGPNCRDAGKLQLVVNSKSAARLTSGEKGMLAIRDVIDPLNLLTIAGYSGIATAANSHSAYGPGFKGFGRLFGYSLLQGAQGEFFGTYLIPSIAHQDPRYHRMTEGTIPRRVLHALAHTVVTSHDDGSAMPNYATLLTYPISAELSNFYVPGIQTDSKSTFKRIAIGLATDPAGSLLAEFLPDLARRVHVRVIFVQQILNQVATGAPNTL